MISLKVYYEDQDTEQTLLNGIDQDTYSVTEVLDETFDYGTFSMIDDGSVSIKQKGKLTIEEWEGATLARSCKYIVSNVGEVQIRFINGAEIYEREISFVENSQLLADTICPSMASTQPLPSVWDDTFASTDTTIFNYTGTTDAYSVSHMALTVLCVMRLLQNNRFTTGRALQNAAITLPSFNRKRYVLGVGNLDDNEFYFRIFDSNDNVVLEGWGSNYNANTPLSISTPGIYTVKIYFFEHEFEASISSADPKSQYFFYWELQIAENQSIKQSTLDERFYSGMDVAEKLVYNCVPFWNIYGNIRSKFYVNSNDKLINTVAPDQYYTQNNLYQNLLLVGRMINSIPRLEKNSWENIEFIDLSEETPIPDGILTEKTSNVRISNIDGYCGATVSDLENMVSGNKFTKPTIKDTWRMLSSNDGKRLTADNAVYKSDYPIYAATHFLINYNNLGVKDIGKYLYEAAIWETLDVTSSTSLNSKTYAVKYSQYSNVIDSFTTTQANVLINGVEIPAICRIIRDLYEIPIDIIMYQNWPYNTAFRLEYQPVTNCRLKQYRADALKFGTDELLANQQVNIGAVENVGLSMKNTLDQLGNTTVTISRFFNEGETLPEINQVAIIDGEKYKLVQSVKAFSSTGYDLSMTFSKNFNRLNTIQSLSTEKRWEDVSLRSAIVRPINVDEYAIFVEDIPEDTPNITNYKTMLSKTGKKAFVQGLCAYTDVRITADKPAFFRFRPLDADGNLEILNNTFGMNVAATDTLILPIDAKPYANSIAFTVDFKDNYGCGTALVQNGNYLYSVSVPYGNTCGTIKKLNYQICVHERDQVLNGDLTTSKQGPLTHTPLWSEDMTYVNSYYPITVDKDSREALRFTYQLHSVTNTPNIILGPALQSLNPLVLPKAFRESNVRVRTCVLNKHFSTNNTAVKDEDIVEQIGSRMVMLGNQSLSENYKANDIYVAPTFTGTFGSHCGGYTNVCIGVVADYTVKRIDGYDVHVQELIVGRNIVVTEAVSDLTSGNQLAIGILFRHDLENQHYQ